MSDYEELGFRHLGDQGRRTEGFTAWDIYKDLIKKAIIVKYIPEY